MEELMAYQHWLNCIPGIGKKTAEQLLKYAGTVQDLYQISEKEAESVLKGEKLIQFIKSKEHWNVEQEYSTLLEKGISLYSQEHPRYPARLRDIPDAPGSIYVMGRLPNEEKISVAIIGARRCSEYGRYMARQYGEALAKAGMQVISGMASGVDSISQQGVIAAGGETFAVLGCGVDVCYPKEKWELYRTIPNKGGIISEYIPGTLPKAGLFPPRNRIISGLADAVVVIEAKEKSGTLITVDMALEQGREVFALPGRVTDALSRGCNRLIKQGAGMVLSPEDLIFELTGKEGGSRCEERHLGEEVLFDTVQEKEIWHLLDDYPQSIQDIVQKRPDITIPMLLRILMELCMSGKAQQITSGYYVRNKS